jgi:hypothetical protein
LGVDFPFTEKLGGPKEPFLQDITSPEFYKKGNYQVYLNLILTKNKKVDPMNVNDTISCAIKLAEFY